MPELNVILFNFFSNNVSSAVVPIGARRGGDKRQSVKFNAFGNARLVGEHLFDFVISVLFISEIYYYIQVPSNATQSTFVEEYIVIRSYSS